MKITKLPFITIVILGILFLSGCNQASTKTVDETVQQEIIEVGLMLDKSSSANATRTIQPTFDDIKPLIDRIKLSGGELGVGLVTDDSNKPLVRLRIEVRPVPPYKPSDEGDAEQIASEYDKYNKDLKTFEKNLATWKQETEKGVQKFTTEVEQLLALKPKAKRTDVMNALNRVDLFLAEKSVFPANTKKFIILNSDAQDNVKARLNKLNSSAKLIVVNGIGSVGSLKDLKPELFESLDAAINQIVKGEE